MNVKDQIRQHLDGLGFAVSEPHAQRVERLRRVLSVERFYRCMELAAGPTTYFSLEMCKTVPDLETANLVRSLDNNVVLETSIRLYERSAKYFRPGTRVIDLGCYTGALASFIAVHHPECEVIGVDRLGPYVQEAKSYYKLDNLSFVEWDYENPKPPDLLLADVLISGLGICNSAPGKYSIDLDPHCLRGHEGFRREREEAAIIFRNWRLAAKDDSRLIAVLRLASYALMLAFVDAATQTGWAPDLSATERVVLSGEQWPIPLMEFDARAAASISEDEVLSRWIALNHAQEGMVDVHSGAALALYRMLPDPCVLSSRTVSSLDGAPTREEVGTAGPLGYIFLQNTQPGFRLRLIPAAVAEQYARRPAFVPWHQSAPVISLAGVPEGASIAVLSKRQTC